MNKQERSSQARLWLLPSVAVFVFVFIFWGSLLFMPKMMNADGDLGRHLTVGRIILERREIPTTDVFSHTKAGAFMVPHEWLSQLLFAMAYRLAGLNGVAWLTALVLAVTYALLTSRLQRAGVRAFLALIMGFTAAMVGAIHALTRPHLFTLLFFTIFLLTLEAHRQEQKRRLLVLLLPLMVVWANLHGAFISGLILVLLYSAGAVLERKMQRAFELGGLLLALILVSLLNPVGAAMISNSFAYLQERFLVDLTIEYRSPNFHLVSAWPFAALLLLSIVLGWQSRRHLDWTSLLTLGSWTAFALYSGRNIPLYAQVATAILAPELDAWIAERLPALDSFLSRTDKSARLSWGWFWALAAVAILIGQEASGAKLDVYRMGNVFDPQVFPIAAVDTLEEKLPQGQVFNEFTWGGYLLFRLWPEKQVFIDGQTDFYGESLTREFLQVVEAEPGWEAVLDRYSVQWIIIPPARPLAAWLNNSPEWELIYQDETAAVWQRQNVAGD